MARNELMDPVEQDEMTKAFAMPLATGRELTTQRSSGGGLDVEVSGGVITARRCEVERDEGKVLQRIAALAAAAGAHWLYSYPVKKKGGATDRIEGLSIKGANNVARLYGNCQVDCRVLDAGNDWIIYARFVDYETGFSLTRPFQQSKAASRLGGEDNERRLQIALSIGVSKAERNVVTNALEAFCDYAFEEAKKDLVNKVGRRLDEYKQRVIDRLGALDVITARAERTVGRAVAQWTAHDVARLIAEIKAVSDGMATADETWPVPTPAEPRRSDAATTSQEQAPTAATAPRQDAQPEGAAGSQTATAGAGSASASPVGPREIPPLGGDETAITREEDGEALLDKVEPPAPHEEEQDGRAEAPRSRWELPPDIVGQDGVIAALGELLGTTRTQADVDQLLAFHAERLERLQKGSGTKGSKWRMDVKARRDAISAGRVS